MTPTKNTDMNEAENAPTPLEEVNNRLSMITDRVLDIADKVDTLINCVDEISERISGNHSTSGYDTGFDLEEE